MKIIIFIIILSIIVTCLFKLCGYIINLSHEDILALSAASSTLNTSGM